MGDECETERDRKPRKTEMEDLSSTWRTNVVLVRGFAPGIRYSDRHLSTLSMVLCFTATNIKNKTANFVCRSRKITCRF